MMRNLCQDIGRGLRGQNGQLFINLEGIATDDLGVDGSSDVGREFRFSGGGRAGNEERFTSTRLLPCHVILEPRRRRRTLTAAKVIRILAASEHDGWHERMSNERSVHDPTLLIIRVIPCPRERSFAVSAGTG